jgi:hypothetical protein
MAVCLSAGKRPGISFLGLTEKDAQRVFFCFPGKPFARIDRLEGSMM